MYLDRRELLKIGGAGIAGLAVSSLDLPFLSLKPALATALSDDAWCFGVMADTQWRTGTSSGGEPASCAVTIIDALNQQFINYGCKFVIQVGDLVNNENVGTNRTLPTRAAHCQALYDAGIGFYPVRGNHEASATAAGEMRTLFPQNMGEGANALGGVTNFTYPMDTLKGLSYSFDYNNVRCVLIDQFTRPDGSGSNNNDNLLDQLDWVESTLTSKSASQHVFVMGHKNLYGQNHKDVITGSSLTANAAQRDRFIQMMDVNNVAYYLGGHDHMHHRSVVVTNSLKTVYSAEQIICSSNSYKFYIPNSNGNDGREIPVCQELFTIGFYIVTVDGPRVTVDFYSASHRADYGDTDLVTPPSVFNFYLRERFGYSLNGDRFVVARGGAYTDQVGSSSYKGYTAKILSGLDGNTETDYLGRSLYKTVNTGWAESTAVANAASPIFSLWGTVDNLSLYNAGLTGLLPAAAEATVTDTYTLSLSYNPKKFRPTDLASGKVAIAVSDAESLWQNAVALNTGGTKKFVYGPWKESYGLGTYGVDPKTSTAWAVLNNEGDFVVKLV